MKSWTSPSSGEKAVFVKLPEESAMDSTNLSGRLGACTAIVTTSPGRKLKPVIVTISPGR